MDCNREEALRAKQMAEKKMDKKDFSGALKIAVKAQQLYPELDNISQLILVCEVHCSAEKSYGTDKDWYDILKIEPSADDISIKKQYRKLALILHPDKNKFSGSTDAFKLIGEAQRVLLDRQMRVIHDSKRRAFGNYSAPNWIPRQPSRQSNVQHRWNQSSFSQAHSVNSQFQSNYAVGHSGNFQYSQQRAQTGVSGKRSTFWTVCPYCSIRYQFFREDVLNKVIPCQNCKKSFHAYELNAQGSTQSHQPPSFPQQNKVPKTVFTSKPVSGGVNSQRKKPSKAQRNNVNRKRKKVETSSESSDDESSSESEEDVEDFNKHQASQHFQNSGEQPRRSSRTKRNVSYKENVNDNDDEPKVKDTFWKEEVREVVEEDQREKFQTKYDNKKSQCKPTSDDKGENVDANVEEAEPEVYVCPDPQFYDFEKDKKEECFIAGQTWAVYDNEDAMPRFYAYIRKVESPGFHLLITWLKPMPENDDEEKWLEAELPVSCGKFKREKHDKATDLPMFSHKVLEAPPQKGVFTIVPRKGETWALFRDWSINWHSCTETDTRSFKYELVEILLDYTEDVGVRVSYLEKVKGFVSLYRSREGGEMLIPESDRYRLSHMVPSCRMSGEEGEGIPKGCFELDPAGLPSSAFE